MANGYAVTLSGEIDVRTVSPTERAAMVNWLIAARGVLVLADATDAQIRKAFEKVCASAGARVVPVKISEVTAH